MLLCPAVEGRSITRAPCGLWLRQHGAGCGERQPGHRPGSSGEQHTRASCRTSKFYCFMTPNPSHAPMISVITAQRHFCCWASRRPGQRTLEDESCHTSATSNSTAPAGATRSTTCKQLTQQNGLGKYIFLHLLLHLLVVVLLLL